jgi:hypothetical protein
MTEEEALALNPGDRVEVKVDGKWATATVLKSGTGDLRFRGQTWVSMRRVGLTHSGRPFNRIVRHGWELKHVRLVRRLDPLTANVYADWLDDRGQHEAARMLREAFPLGPPAELP